MKNKLKRLPNEFKSILKIISKIAASLGLKTYLVGGVVRDLILRKAIFDLDIVVEGDAVKLVKRLAKELNTEFCRHHVFGTATLYFGDHKIDFATARIEEYLHPGALPKVKPNSIDRDLYRRDFTINSMAVSLNKGNYGKLIDLYNGLEDLKKGLIRVLHEKSFLDDPTRILRAIRFEQRFGFKIENKTLKLMKKALVKKAINFVNLHRLREEVILILKESKPYCYIKRIEKLVGLSFIDKKIKLTKEDSKIFSRIQSVVTHYQKKHKKHRKLQVWLIYLTAILAKLSSVRLRKVLCDFGFRKGERIIIVSAKEGMNKVKKLDSTVKPGIIYQNLIFYSFESILFFYAYCPRSKLRQNIDIFLDKLVNVQVLLGGKDLKRLNIEPAVLYGRILEEVLLAKINKQLSTKGQEEAEALKIFKRIKKYGKVKKSYSRKHTKL